MKYAVLIALSWGPLFAQPANWPAQLDKDVKSGSWPAAERVGQATVEEIEAGRLFPRFADVTEEAKVRNLFGAALEHNGKFDQAREQRSIAREILSAEPKSRIASAERARRILQLKADVLATEIKLPARIPFARPGVISIVAFSASWCAPCVKEVQELRRFPNPSATVVVIDVDRLSSDDKAAYLPLDSLTGAEVPQLYVVDRDGNIRFHLKGFEDDGWFAAELDWMIAAALVEP